MASKLTFFMVPAKGRTVRDDRIAELGRAQKAAQTIRRKNGHGKVSLARLPWDTPASKK